MRVTNVIEQEDTEVEVSVRFLTCPGYLEDEEVLTMKIKEGALDEACRKLLEVDDAQKQNVL